MEGTLHGGILYGRDIIQNGYICKGDMYMEETHIQYRKDIHMIHTEGIYTEEIYTLYRLCRCSGLFIWRPIIYSIGWTRLLNKN